ncbi:sensor histidine kinase [Pseudoduganella namucuonensis]|uniref:histidine kinase n=1 Tax=Pseudoduganella namucuonensis TaxID=1035707 RepID=A0A1I7M2H7_9BURK|nr:sensor histidine kinase [Pseudoduganella namucuonensis]SFV16047.1 Signal transduction histidine kinase [Pseudoduganella namucuonensis]
MKLRTHYWLLAFCIVFPVAVFCSIALDMLLSSQRAQSMNHIEESARSAALEIDAEVRRAQSVLRTLANSHALASGDMRRFYAEAGAANAGEGGWIILYDGEGQQLINTRLPFGADLPRRPDVDVLRKQLASGAGVVSAVKWGPSLKRQFVAVEQPITTATGARHVIAQAFAPEYFTRTFSGRAIPASWPIWVIDGNGALIARRDKGDGKTGHPVPAAVLAAVRAAPAGALRHEAPDGTEVYAYFVHSGLSDWAVIVGAPVSEVDARVLEGMSVAIIGFLIAIVGAVSLGVHTGRRLVRFVSGASNAARGLGGEAAVVGLRHSNIGEMEALNEAIREADARLRREMASRTRAERERNELLERERAARETAEQQNAAKDEFLAMLGHELRNPLAAITSAVAVLDHASVPGMPAEAGTRAREVLRRQTSHLGSLVDDLLEVNRALMGKLALNCQPLDLADALRCCLETLHAGGRLAAHGLEVAAASAPVLADATRLAQVIDNILDNAIKYSPPATLIRVAVARDGDAAVLTVRDEGMGIAADLLPHVFKVFVQGKQSLQRVQGGLGIGLTLVRRLVEMHGGTIVIASAGANQGTTVTVRLPLNVAGEAGAGNAGKGDLTAAPDNAAGADFTTVVAVAAGTDGGIHAGKAETAAGEAATGNAVVGAVRDVAPSAWWR